MHFAFSQYKIFSDGFLSLILIPILIILRGRFHSTYLYRLIACWRKLPGNGIVFPALFIFIKSVTMNKALSQLSVNEDKSSKQMAIVIPLHPVEKVVAKRYRKKALPVKKEIQDSTPVPTFTSPVFRPKKHDLL